MNNSNQQDSRLRRFMQDLRSRYERILHVIDEALQSENLRERTWAVDLLVKKFGAWLFSEDLKSEEPAESSKKTLSRDEMLAELNQLFKDTPPDS